MYIDSVRIDSNDHSVKVQSLFLIFYQKSCDHSIKLFIKRQRNCLVK